MSRLVVDTAPLVLLVVGTVDVGLIRKHKNTSIYSENDFRRLTLALARAGCLIVTANIATETSNLLRQIGDPDRMRLSLALSELLRGFEEKHITSAVAMQDVDYARLGLADAVTLALLGSETGLLTTDAELFGAARKRNLQAALFRPAAERY